MQRAYLALPIACLSRTRLYLMQQPTHAWAIRHPNGERCVANWAGEDAIDGLMGHLVRHTETQIAEMPQPEFEARHRRRIALESFMQPTRIQDSWPEPMGAYLFMADFLNKGEREFLEDADWATVVPRRRRRSVELQEAPLINQQQLGASLDALKAAAA